MRHPTFDGLLIQLGERAHRAFGIAEHPETLFRNAPRGWDDVIDQLRTVGLVSRNARSGDRPIERSSADVVLTFELRAPHRALDIIETSDFGGPPILERSPLGS